MENESRHNEQPTSYMPSEFTEPGFLFDVKNAENIVGRSAVSRSEIRSAINYVEEALTGYITGEYLNTTVEAIGRAYFADHHGNIVYVADGKPKNDIISARGLKFIGIEMLYIEHDSDEKAYKAFCRFNRSRGGSNLETLYFAPEDLIVMRPKPKPKHANEAYAEISAEEENELIKSVLKFHADNTRQLLTSPRFTLAHGEEQHRILKMCAQDSAEFINDEYGKKTIEIEASEFLVVTESGILHVDQRLKPREEWNIPMGQFGGCTFYELITQAPNSKIQSMHWRQPSIVLSNYETGSLYLVPLLAFESANVIED